MNERRLRKNVQRERGAVDGRFLELEETLRESRSASRQSERLERWAKRPGVACVTCTAAVSAPGESGATSD